MPSFQNLVIVLVLSIVKCEDNLNFNPAVPIEIERTPTIFVPILIRNKAHAIPYFFSYFENLDYPKEKISLWWVNFIFLIRSSYFRKTGNSFFNKHFLASFWKCSYLMSILQIRIQFLFCFQANRLVWS